MLSSIYCYKFNGEKILISTLENDNINIVISNVPYSVIDISYKISKYLKNLDDNLVKLIRYSDTNEYINAYCSKIYRWRRCTAIVVLQESIKGWKLLLYAWDAIHHNGTSFGTSINIFDNRKEYLNILLDGFDNIILNYNNITFPIQEIKNIINLELSNLEYNESKILDYPNIHLGL